MPANPGPDFFLLAYGRRQMRQKSCRYFGGAHHKWGRGLGPDPTTFGKKTITFFIPFNLSKTRKKIV